MFPFIVFMLLCCFIVSIQCNRKTDAFSYTLLATHSSTYKNLFFKCYRLLTHRNISLSRTRVRINAWRGFTLADRMTQVLQSLIFRALRSARLIGDPSITDILGRFFNRYHSLKRCIFLGLNLNLNLILLDIVN